MSRKIFDGYHRAGDDVYHDDHHCEMGSAILPDERIKGKGELPLCPECERLARPKQPRKAFGQ